VRKDERKLGRKIRKTKGRKLKRKIRRSVEEDKRSGRK
jgi:hypothetical protein